jgi:hypothetical protein
MASSHTTMRPGPCSARTEVERVTDRHRRRVA